MDAVAEREGPLTYGVEIEIHVPVLKAPENDPIQKALEFPADDWYERNCLFYTKEDGRKIPVVEDDVQVNREARQAVWNQLLELFKETMEKPNRCGAEPDIRVMTAETEHPQQTFVSGRKEQDGNANASEKKPGLDPNVLGEFVDGHYEVYNAWTVCQDTSGSWYPGADGNSFQPMKVPPIGPKEYSWFSIEIKTQVYKDLELLEQDLQKVCDRIRARFLVSINCGRGDNRSSTHVHIGRSGKWDPDDENMPFRLNEAMMLATVMYMLEPVLMTLHAPWKQHYHRYAARLHGYTNLEGFCEQKRPPKVDWKAELDGLGPFDPSPRPEDKAYTEEDFRLSLGQRRTMDFFLRRPDMGFPPIEGSPYEAGVSMIWAADDMTQLAWLLSCREGARRGAFSLQGLVRSEPGVLGSRHLNTIEFRHMHGSLDAREITNWIRVVRSPIVSSSRDYYGALGLILRGESDIAKILESAGLRLSIKSPAQIAAQTSIPQIPVGENGEPVWRGKGNLMFLPKPSGSIPLSP
ncbi:hypothetical protein Hte_010318 [Hypoxylon texense]